MHDLGRLLGAEFEREDWSCCGEGSMKGDLKRRWKRQPVLSASDLHCPALPSSLKCTPTAVTTSPSSPWTASPARKAGSLCSLQQVTSNGAFRSSWLTPPQPSNETQKTLLQLISKSPGRRKCGALEGDPRMAISPTGGSCQSLSSVGTTFGRSCWPSRC